MAFIPTNQEIHQKWSPNKIKFLKFLAISLIIAPVCIWALFMNNLRVNVPYMDEFAIVAFLKKISENNFQISDLFNQHNEHRIFFPNIITVTLSEISRLNTNWFIYFSFFLLCLILLLLYLIFSDNFKEISLSLIWFVPVSWFIFNFTQTFGMLWGFELCVYLSIFGFFIAIYSLDKSKDLDKWLIFALLGGILSTFSFFNGLLVWPIGFVLIYLTKQSKMKFFIVWSFFTLLSYGFFFNNWSHPSQHPSMFFIFQNPISSLEFFIVNVGCPVFRSDTIWTFVFGVIVVFSIIIVTSYIIKNRLYSENALYISILLFSLGSSFMITVGRSGFGIDQATASHYVSFSMMGIIGLYFILLNLFFKNPTSSKFLFILLFLVIFLIFIGVITAFITGISQAEQYHAQQKLNEYSLFHYKTIPLDELKSLYPDPNIAYNLATFLDNEKLSVFAPGDKTIERKEIYQRVSGQPVGEIISGMTVGQTFNFPYSDLSSIDVFMADYDRSNTKEVMFHLRDSPSSSNDIVSITINARELHGNSYYKFKFPEIHDSENKSYYFFIDSPGSVTGDAITIWSSKDDAYPQGTAYINSKPIPGDLVFSVNYLY
jgi:hypothetical protein